MYIYDREFWSEVVNTIKSQKMRSIMTAFGVFWGLVMLMFLLGAGMGFKEGLVGQLNKIPSNMVGYSTSSTSMSYNGFERGRVWHIEADDITLIQSKYPGILKNAIYVKFLPTNGSSLEVSSGEKTDNVTVVAVSPFYGTMSPQRIVSGRYLNEFDCNEFRKVCVIGDQVAKSFFSDENEAVGQKIKIDGNIYDIVGVTKKTNNMVNFSSNESASIFLPITTGQHIYDCVNKSDYLYLELNDRFPSGEYYQKIGTILRNRHNIHPEDEVALFGMDLKSQLNQFDTIMSGLNALIWLVGLGTLIAGLIGISNIMLVTVKERTQEIGIRRALGTGPRAIIVQIMCESLVLSLSAGLLGIVTGAWGMYAVNRVTSGAAGSGGFFTNPYVPMVPACAAFLILVAGGLVAGYFPAKKAINVKLIDALHFE